MTPSAGRPFLRSEARHLSDRELRRGYRALFHGVHVHRQVPVGDLELAEAALMVAEPGSYVSHHTAARLLGAIVPDHPDVHVTSRRQRVKGAGLSGHRSKAGQRIVQWGAIRMTSPVQTFLDLAHYLPLVDLVVLGDSLVARGRTTSDALVVAADAVRGRHAAIARRAAGLVRAGVDSPMESRLRMLLVLAGLPEPVVNHIEYAEDGRWRRRFDLSYPEVRVAIEDDGRQHAESDRQWERDVERREDLDRDDWRIVVVLAKGIYREPGRTLERVVDAVVSRGTPARVASDEWRLYFGSS